MSGELKMAENACTFLRRKGGRRSKLYCPVNLLRLEQVMRIGNDQWLFDQPANELEKLQYYPPWHRRTRHREGRTQLQPIRCPVLQKAFAMAMGWFPNP